MQDLISALLSMPPNHTSNVAHSHRGDEGDVEGGDDPHEADLPIEEQPQPHGNQARRYKLDDITPRPPLRGFCVV